MFNDELYQEHLVILQFNKFYISHIDVIGVIYFHFSICFYFVDLQ